MAALNPTVLKRYLTFYVVAVALITVSFALLNARVAHPWIIGEWLINYSGGFARRGLLGEALLLVHHATGLPLVGLTAALQVGLYGLFYASLLPLLRGLRWSVPLLALLLSPATLAFTVLDPPTSVRKEILLFLALSLLINAVVSLRPPVWQLALGLSIAGPILVLAHEGLAAFLPYLFMPILTPSRGGREIAPPRRFRRLLTVPLLLCLLACAAVFTHPGGREQAQIVCQSVGGQIDGQPGGLCNGAIAYLARTPAQARAETLRAIHFYRYGTRYPLPILLAALPIALIFVARLRANRHDLATRRLLLITGLALLLSLPLFVVARDWGRWIEIHATCLLLLFLLLERVPEASAADISPDAESRYTPPPVSMPHPLQLVGLALYATCWTLPAVGIFPGRFGYIDLLRYVHSYRSKPHLSTVAVAEGLRSPAFRIILVGQAPSTRDTMQLYVPRLRPTTIGR